MGQKRYTYMYNVSRIKICTHNFVWIENIYVHMRYQCSRMIFWYVYTYSNQQYGHISKPYPPSCCASRPSGTLSSSNCCCCAGEPSHVSLLFSDMALLNCYLWYPPLRGLSGAACLLCCRCCFASSVTNSVVWRAPFAAALRRLLSGALRCSCCPQLHLLSGAARRLPLLQQLCCRPRAHCIPVFL